jgi:hypothetical protein
MSADEEETTVAPQPEEPPARRRRRTVRRRGGYTRTGQSATAMAAPPASVTISDQPAVPVPEAQDDADGDQGADG